MFSRVRSLLLWMLPVLALVALVGAITVRKVSCNIRLGPGDCVSHYDRPISLVMFLAALALMGVWAILLVMGRRNDST